MRCASGGRVCEGYDGWPGDHPASPRSGSASHEASSRAIGSAPSLTLTQRPRTTLGPVGVKVNLSDMSMFDALRFQIVELVAGSFDHAFWVIDVLRACQVQPAIWHASLALTALHQSRRHHAVDTFRKARHERLSMTHSTAAIQHVIALTRREQLCRAERETLLLASLLLTALSSMQGDLPQAVMHASNCIQLFHQWRLWMHHRSSATSRGSMLNADSIGAMVAHLEMQLLSRLKYIDVPPWGSPDSPPRCTDISFDSSTDPYHEFQPLFTSLIGMWQHAGMGVRGQPRPEIDVRHPYLVEFQRWKVKFDALRLYRASGRVDAESMLTLHLHWHFMQIGLKANVYIGEVAFDEFLPVFKDLVVDARELLEVVRNSAGASADRNAPPAFSFTMSIVEGLFWAGHGCREPSTRREILQIIKVWPRREGIWDNALMAAMLETSITLEENAWRSTPRDPTRYCNCVAGIFICNEHRVNNHVVQFLPCGRARVTFETVGNKQRNEPGFEVTLP